MEAAETADRTAVVNVGNWRCPEMVFVWLSNHQKGVPEQSQTAVAFTEKP
jgi:hypothetical protein